MTSSADRGFTLLEVLVGAGLTLLLFTLLYLFLVPAYHAFLRSTTRVDLQQAATLAMGRLAADLQASTPAGVALHADPTILGVNRIATVTDSGAQVWDARLVVYAFYPETHRLIRIECPPPAPFPAPVALTFAGNAPYHATESDLEAISAQPGGGTVLASDVDALAITTVDLDGNEVGTPGVGDPLVVTLRLQRKEAHQQEPETFTLKRYISLKQRI